MKQSNKEQVLWAALSAGAVIGASIMARKSANSAWRQLRGDEPPTDAADPSATWRDLAIWAVVSGVSVAVARFTAQGLASKLWRKQIGHRPPGA